MLLSCYSTHTVYKQVKNLKCAQLPDCGVAVFTFLPLMMTLFSCSSFISSIHFGEQKHSNATGPQFVPSRILSSVLYNILYVVSGVKWSTNSLRKSKFWTEDPLKMQD